jgi:hypothetical protein
MKNANNTILRRRDNNLGAIRARESETFIREKKKGEIHREYVSEVFLVSFSFLSYQDITRHTTKC